MCKSVVQEKLKYREVGQPTETGKIVLPKCLPPHNHQLTKKQYKCILSFNIKRTEVTYSETFKRLNKAKACAMCDVSSPNNLLYILPTLGEYSYPSDQFFFLIAKDRANTVIRPINFSFLQQKIERVQLSVRFFFFKRSGEYSYPSDFFLKKIGRIQLSV